MSLSKTAAGAGLTGTKMARRVGSVDEFEFKAIGENHNQGVSFCSFYFILLQVLAFELLAAVKISYNCNHKNHVRCSCCCCIL